MGPGCEKASSDQLWGHCQGWFLPALRTWRQWSSQWWALVQLCYQENLVLWDTWSKSKPPLQKWFPLNHWSADYMRTSAVWTLWFLPDESCLSCRVLTHHQHHRLVVKVCILVARGVKVMERIVLLYRQQPLIIKILQLLCHHVDIPECFRVAPEPPDGHGDGFLLSIFSVWRLLALLGPNWMMEECAQGILSDSHSCLLHPAAGHVEGGEGVTRACSCT